MPPLEAPTLQMASLDVEGSTQSQPHMELEDEVERKFGLLGDRNLLRTAVSRPFNIIAFVEKVGGKTFSADFFGTILQSGTVTTRQRSEDGLFLGVAQNCRRRCLLPLGWLTSRPPSAGWLAGSTTNPKDSGRGLGEERKWLLHKRQPRLERLFLSLARPPGASRGGVRPGGARPVPTRLDNNTHKSEGAAV